MIPRDPVMTHRHREGVTGHNTVGVTLVTRWPAVTSHHPLGTAGDTHGCLPRARTADYRVLIVHQGMNATTDPRSIHPLEDRPSRSSQGMHMGCHDARSLA